MNSKSVTLVKNTIVIAFGKLAAQFLVFFLLPLYTHYLSPEEYGVVDLLLTYSGLAILILILQIDRGAFRLLVDARNDDEKSSQIISSSLCIAFGVILISGLIMSVLVQFAYAPILMAVSFLVISMLLCNLLMQFSRGFGQNSNYALASVVLATSTLSLVFVSIGILDMGAIGAIIAIAASNVITGVFLFIKLRLHKYIRPNKYSSAIGKELLRFSLPLVPSAVSWWVIQAADRTILSIFLGVASTGLYAAASRYSLVLTAFNAIFDLSWTESASEHIGSRDRDKFFSNVYNTSFRLFASIAICLIAVTPFIFNILVGEKYSEARNLVPILVLGGFVHSIVTQYSVIYIAKKITKKVLITSMTAAAVSLILNLSLIHFIGIYAPPVAIVISFSVIAVWRHFDIKQYVNITFTRLLFPKLILLFALVIGLYYINSTLSNVANLIVALAAFVFMAREPGLALASRLRQRLSTR